MDEEALGWEKLLGEDTLKRLKFFGSDSNEYRKSTIGLAPVNEQELKLFSKYLHKTGAQALRLRLSEEAKEEDQEMENLKKRKVKLNKIIRRKINSVEMDDDLVGIIMDKEWDTSFWSNQEIVAGCEAIIMIFQSNEVISDAKKAQAILMLEKLIFRHEAAANYVRISLDPLIARTTSKKYRRGQSAAQLDILHVLYNCRENFTNDFSQFKFISRMCDLLLLEAKLGCTLIQHAYRAKKDSQRPKELLPTEEGFGSVAELSRLRYRALNERSNELRHNWNVMHCKLSKNERRVVGGVRGPVHFSPVYMNLALEIMITLVSESGGELAHSNREDLIRGNGVILLCGFLAAPSSGQYSVQAAKLLTQVAKCAESLPSMLHSGIAKCTLVYIKYVSKTLNSMVSNTYLDAVNIIQRLAVHASGVRRAREGYGFIKPKHLETEETDYRIIVAGFGNKLSSVDIMKLLGPPELVIEMVSSLQQVNSLVTVRCLLNCLYSLCCCDCYPTMLCEVVAFGGRLMRFLVDRLEDSDVTIATYSLGIFLQLCTLAPGREALLAAEIYEFISPLLITSSNYKRVPYQRALLISAALSRQRDCRMYDPTAFPESLGKDGAMEELIYMDYLDTLKRPVFGETHNFASLVLLSTDLQAAEQSSKMIRQCAMQFSDYLCHPNDEQYFYHISWEKISAACVILEGISADPDTADTMFSAGTVRFLASAINLAKFELLGKPMSDKRAALILNCAVSASNCLSHLCDTDEIKAISPFAHLTYTEKFFDPSLKFNTNTLKFDTLRPSGHVNAEIIIHGFESMDIAGALSFLLSTMGTANHNISPANKSLQEAASLAAAILLAAYSTMLIRIDENHKELGMLIACGPIVSNIVGKLKDNFGITQKMSSYLNTMCRLLVSVTSSLSVAVEAIQKWRIIQAFSVHLPPPLSGLAGDAGFKTRELSYQLGLGYLPSSYFDTLTSLTKVEKGKIEIINGGFLRRALDKAHLLQGELESADELAVWSKLIKAKRPPLPISSQRRNIIACLRLIESCANFHSQSTGNANDLIISPSYDIIALCKEIMNIPECPRSDPAYITALSLLTTLSSDGARVMDLLVKHDFFDLLHGVLRSAETQPPIVISKVIECLFNIVSSPQSIATISKLKSMKPALLRTARLVPEFVKKINEINFKLNDIEMGPGAKLVGMEIKITSEIADELEDLNIAELRVNNEIDDPMKPPSLRSCEHGSYGYCGVSSCGSLRFPGTPDKHGDFQGLSEAEVSSRLLRLPLCSPSRKIHQEFAGLTENDKRNELYLLEVSRLSARDENFRNMVLKNKASFGLTEKQLFDLNTMKSRSSSRNSTSRQNETQAVDTPIEMQSPLKAQSSRSFSRGSSNFPFLSEDEMNQFGITRVDTAPSRSHSRVLKSRVSSTRGSSPNKSSFSKKSSSAIMCGIRSVDLQDAPEFKHTRPLPSTSNSNTYL